MKRAYLVVLIVGLLIGVVAGLLMDRRVSAQGRIRGSVMYLSGGLISTEASGGAVAYCFTYSAGGGVHCIPAR